MMALRLARGIPYLQRWISALCLWLRSGDRGRRLRSRTHRLFCKRTRCRRRLPDHLERPFDKLTTAVAEPVIHASEEEQRVGGGPIENPLDIVEFRLNHRHWG